MRDATDDRLPEHPRALTLEAWAARDEDESGELVDGVLVEEEVPSYLHEWIVTWLLVKLGSWILPRGGGIVPSEIKLAVRPDRGRKADLVIHLPGVRLPNRHSALLREPPSIVVEVISPQPRDARRDRVDKLDEYATFRVPWYWIVDPGLQSFEVYELGADGRYVRALGASDGPIAMPGCDGLMLDLDDLWAHVARLNDDE